MVTLFMALAKWALRPATSIDGGLRLTMFISDSASEDCKDPALVLWPPLRGLRGWSPGLRSFTQKECRQDVIATSDRDREGLLRHPLGGRDNSALRKRCVGRSSFCSPRQWRWFVISSLGFPEGATIRCGKAMTTTRGDPLARINYLALWVHIPVLFFSFKGVHGVAPFPRPASRSSWCLLERRTKETSRN